MQRSDLSIFSLQQKPSLELASHQKQTVTATLKRPRLNSWEVSAAGEIEAHSIKEWAVLNVSRR